jgi:RNA polymerase sigma-70 factor (ECF subfamily)
MGKGPFEDVVQHIRRLVDAQTLAGAADADLVTRFIRSRDERAFATLLRRHGPMVLSVCHGVLGQREDAEDVFQATFILLARKARSIRKRESLASWLHGVAHRLALRAKTQRRFRRAQERKAAAMRSSTADFKESWQDLRPLLDEEMGKLPEQYRTALILCYLEGKTHEEIAQELGCPVGTVRSRVGRGRKLLQGRLVHRGLTLSAGSFAAFSVASTASAAISAQVFDSTLKACLQAGSATVSARVSVQTFPEMGQGLLFAGDGKAAIVGDNRGNVRFLDPASGKELRRITFPGDPQQVANRIEDLALSLDGKELIAIVRRSSWEAGGRTAENTVTITWDLGTGKETFRRQEAADRFPWRLSSDGTLRASYNHGPVSTIRRVRTGQELLSLDGKCEGIFPVCFSRDSRILASVCHHGLEQPVTVVLWELATGNEIHRFKPHLKGWRISLAFSADGSILAAGGDEEGGVQLWDLTTGRELCQYRGYGTTVTSLTFSRDGHRLASGLFNGTALIWEVEPALRRGPTKEPDHTAKDLDQMWTDLGMSNAAIGQKALWSLAVRPNQAIPFLKSHLQPAAEADPHRIRQLVADLDSNQFTIREAAAKALEQQEQQAEPLLRQALAGKLSTEARRRVEAILARPRQARSADTLRSLRAIQVLEYIGSGETRDLLDVLSRGSSAAWETQEAKSSLMRLGKRP